METTKEPWILDIPPLATPPLDELDSSHEEIDEQHARLCGELKEHLKEKSENSSCFVYSVIGDNFPAAKEGSIQYGGHAHIDALCKQFDQKAFELYTELCRNTATIAEIYVVSSGSGAFFALRMLQLIQNCGSQLHKYPPSPKEFSSVWQNLLQSGRASELKTFSSLFRGRDKIQSVERLSLLPANSDAADLTKLFRSVLVVGNPTLPVPKRKFTLAYFTPPLYRNTEVDALPNSLTVFYVDNAMHPSGPEETSLDIPINYNGKVNRVSASDTLTVLGLLDKAEGDTASDQLSSISLSTDPGTVTGLPATPDPLIQRFRRVRGLAPLAQGQTDQLPIIEVLRTEGDPIAVTAFTNVTQGQLLDGSLVAMKVILRRSAMDKNVERRLAQETDIWSKLQHPNVLPFLGLSITGSQLCSVSPWKEKGSVRRYLRESEFPDRRRLICGIGRGLSYLHSSGVIHGDLKATNILVDHTGDPLLTAFEISHLLDNIAGDTTSGAQMGSIRWMAPERLIPQNYAILSKDARTQESDVYSFGMVIYEIFSGLLPFHGLSQMAVLRAIVDGQHPKHPGEEAVDNGLTHELWQFVESCWSEPGQRPTLDKVEAVFNRPLMVRTPSATTLISPTSSSSIAAVLSHAALITRKDSNSTVTEDAEQAPIASVSDNEKLHNILQELDELNLSVKAERTGETPIAKGGFADVWKGRLGGRATALKVIRVEAQDRITYAQTVVREATIWSKLQHQNVVPFLGVSRGWAQEQFCLVSPWMENGRVTEYIKVTKNPDWKHLILGIAHGLQYLHGEAVIHGDLKGHNVLVDADSTPRLADFGLSAMLGEEDLGPKTFVGSLRWSAPERLDPSRYNPTPQKSFTAASDIFSFGMTVYEIVSGKVPFEGTDSVMASLNIVKGDRPAHPGPEAEIRGLSPELWSFVQECWKEEPDQRPPLKTLDEVLQVDSAG